MWVVTSTEAARPEIVRLARNRWALSGTQPWLTPFQSAEKSFTSAYLGGPHYNIPDSVGTLQPIFLDSLLAPSGTIFFMNE